MLVKAGKPKINYGVVDGGAVRANFLRVPEVAAQTVQVSVPEQTNSVTALSSICSSPPPPPGCITERFYADTGANRSIHPNGRSAISYYRQKLDISTATAGKGMQSEGGKMLLYAPNGDVFPGFDNVVFAKATSEKLAGVGSICDSGMVFVFDKHGLSTYKDTDFKASGKVVTYDERDRKNGLYPLSLHRKKTDHVIDKSSIAMWLATAPEQKEVVVRKFPVTIAPIVNMPKYVPDVDELPAALLSQTYIKSDLSEVERMHAKCGDIGIKYLKRIFPDLKIPKQYRCEYCIEGKIYKFGHGPCAPGRRTTYPPGVFGC